MSLLGLFAEKCIRMYVWMMSGSVSPSKGREGRARSIGPVHTARRSRADTARKPTTGESSAATTTSQPSAPAPAATAASSATSQHLSRVKSMPSKLNADQKSSNAATATAGTPPPTSGRTPSAKRATKLAVPSQATTPTSAVAAKPMPTAPKAMAPRAVPKEPKAMKDVTANKPVTSQKVCSCCLTLYLLFNYLSLLWCCCLDDRTCIQLITSTTTTILASLILGTGLNNNNNPVFKCRMVFTFRGAGGRLLMTSLFSSVHCHVVHWKYYTLCQCFSTFSLKWNPL